MIIRPRIMPVTINMPAPKVGIAGSINVSMRNRDGRRVPVRIDRTKRAFQKVWDHHQSNLITNAGLDSIGTEGNFDHLVQFIAVGTGSGAPATTDTALGAEVARTNANLSLTDDVFSFPSTGLQRLVRGVAFDFGAANGNLTEFGGFLAASGGSTLTRELFRDELGDPVVITKTSDVQLVLDYTLDLSFGPTTMTAQTPITIAGIGDFDIDLMFYQAGFDDFVSYAMMGTLDELRILPVQTVGTTYASKSGGTTYGDTRAGIASSTSSGPGSNQSIEDYVGGSYERGFTTLSPAGTSDLTLGGFVLQKYGLQRYAACGFRFSDPASLVQDKDYRLTLNAKLTWGRA